MGQPLDLLPATALDYRMRAQQRLPRFLFDYIDGGANDELTLAANVADLIMDEYKPQAVSVEVKKFSIPQARFVSVSLGITRPGL